jgi:leucyl aminopeptidase
MFARELKRALAGLAVVSMGLGAAAAQPASGLGPVSISLPQAALVGPFDPKSGDVVVWVAPGALSGPAASVDGLSNGALSRAIEAADFKAKPGDALTLFSIGPFSRVILIGVGAAPLREADLEDYGGRAATAAAAGRPAEVVVYTPDAPGVDSDAAIALRGALLGGYAFGEAKDRARPNPLRRLAFVDAAPAPERARAEADARALAAGVAFARDLISEPSNIKTPQWFVEQTRAAFRGAPNVSFEVLDERAMQRLGMGLMIGVGQGSTRPPRLLIVRYRGAGVSDAPIAFVGKGITFDAGGVSLKDPDGMWRMRYDMSGAAASVGAVLTLSRRGAKVNAVAVAALAENMPDGGAIRPGDVLTAYDGQTVEVLNTDAEGRLVLADALAYLQAKDKPRTVITIATLTGSVRVALGDDYGGLFANDDAAANQIMASGEAAGEPLWRLPIHESIAKDIDSDVADVKNVAEGSGLPGASIGAGFIQAWVKPGQVWLHLDIAGMAWKTSRSPTVPAGAVGYGVRLFDRLVKDHYETK